MKLYEIQDYLNKKVRRNHWSPGDYICFDKGIWVDENGTQYPMSATLIGVNDWEEYREPKRKVKMWPALFKHGDKGRYWISSNLFDSIPTAEEFGGLATPIRLLTEWPAVEVEVDD